MAKTKKVSINAFERVMNESDNYVTFDWHGIEVTVKKVISLKEVMAFVDYVVNNCIGNDGEYYPEIKHFAFNVAVLERYANFATPKNAESAYLLIYRTDAVNCVLAQIDDWQIEEISEAIDKKIEHKLKINADALYAKINGIYDALADVTDRMEETFSDIDPKSFEKLAEAVADGHIDEKKIADAWFENMKHSPVNNG